MAQFYLLEFFDTLCVCNVALLKSLGFEPVTFLKAFVKAASDSYPTLRAIAAIRSELLSISLPAL